jgi:putative hydrolase of HD superfamily
MTQGSGEDDTAFAAQLEALRRGFALKETTRSGWLRVGVAAPESVADHSWGTALLVSSFAEEAGVARDRAVAMAVVHDLPEALTGDTPYRGDISAEADKSVREARAMEDLGTGSPHLRELWEEYEAAATPTARFVRDMNLIEMCLQALLYAEAAAGEGAPAEGAAADDVPVEGAPGAHAPAEPRPSDLAPGDLAEFFTSTEPRLTSDLGLRLFRELRRRYDELCREDQ